jgi:ribosomal protein S18 acetylase RimI-like enzyme
MKAKNENPSDERGRIHIQEMNPNDCEAALSFWNRIGTLGIGNADREQYLRAYLRRNPRLSFVAWEQNEIIGAVLGGHDGRRGTLYHLAVAPKYRKMGIGHLLVEKTLSGLRKLGIRKCHVFVFPENNKGFQFWKALGWTERTDLKMFSYDLIDEERKDGA